MRAFWLARARSGVASALEQRNRAPRFSLFRTGERAVFVARAQSTADSQKPAGRFARQNGNVVFTVRSGPTWFGLKMDGCRVPYHSRGAWVEEYLRWHTRGRRFRRRGR